MTIVDSLPLTSIDALPKERIRFGIILLPNFTLTAFSGFVDMLRLSADEGDYSKPVRCSESYKRLNLSSKKLYSNGKPGLYFFH